MALFSRLQAILILVAVCVFGIAFSFPASTRFFALKNAPQSRRPTSAPFFATSSSSNEIFLLSYDGTVAKTVEWRISQGIDSALAVWPHLSDLYAMHGQDNSWLRNKMRALSHAMVSRTGVSLSCDYALLARLLLEEQELDHGRSNGCSGKYGSQFHPQASTTSSAGKKQGSRPLTVGEIAANWNKGGCLAETLLTKYHIKYQNPHPILQEKIEKLDQAKDYETPSINKVVLDALLSPTSRNIFVTLGHESDLLKAQESLSVAMSPIECKVLSGIDAPMLSLANSTDINMDMDTPIINILPVETTYKALYRGLLEQSSKETILYVFESSWQALEQGIYLFGDNIPRGGSGLASTILGEDRRLSLNFPKWSLAQIQSGQSGRMTQQNEAIMNPWTNLIGESDLAELLSARIVRADLSCFYFHTTNTINSIAANPKFTTTQSQMKLFLLSYKLRKIHCLQHVYALLMNCLETREYSFLLVGSRSSSKQPQFRVN